MDDRTLLELAAKVAGINFGYTLHINGDWDPSYEYSFKPSSGIGGATDISSWNPLENDGDAFRLAHQLKLEFFWGDRFNDIDDISATRRKIVEQAAACYVGE